MSEKKEEENKLLNDAIRASLKSAIEVAGELHVIFFTGKMTRLNQRIYHDGFEIIGEACHTLAGGVGGTKRIDPHKLSIALGSLKPILELAPSVKAPYKAWAECETPADITRYVAYYLESIVRILLSLVAGDNVTKRSEHFFKGPSNDAQLKKVNEAVDKLKTCAQDLEQQHGQLSSPEAD